MNPGRKIIPIALSLAAILSLTSVTQCAYAKMAEKMVEKARGNKSFPTSTTSTTSTSGKSSTSSKSSDPFKAFEEKQKRKIAYNKRMRERDVARHKVKSSFKKIEKAIDRKDYSTLTRLITEMKKYPMRNGCVDFQDKTKDEYNIQFCPMDYVTEKPKPCNVGALKVLVKAEIYPSLQLVKEKTSAGEDYYFRDNNAAAAMIKGCLVDFRYILTVSKPEAFQALKGSDLSEFKLGSHGIFWNDLEAYQSRYKFEKKTYDQVKEKCTGCNLKIIKESVDYLAERIRINKHYRTRKGRRDYAGAFMYYKQRDYCNARITLRSANKKEDILGYLKAKENVKDQKAYFLKTRKRFFKLGGSRNHEDARLSCGF